MKKRLLAALTVFIAVSFTTTADDVSLEGDGIQAQEVSPSAPPELPPEMKRRMLQRIQDQVAPLTAEEIRYARRLLNEMQQVSNNRYEDLEAKITTERLSSRPGSKIPTLHAGVGYNTNVMFSDSAGNPWPIRRSSIGNVEAFTIKELDEHAFEVEVRQANTFTNMTVFLVGQKTPLIFNISPPTEHLDVVKTYIVDGITPETQGEISTQRISHTGALHQPSADPNLNLFLDGSIPESAVTVSVLSGPQVDLWVWNKQLIIRTDMRLMAPTSDVSPLYGANGWRVYSLSRPSSLLSFLRGGELTMVSISESALATIQE